MLFLRIYGYSTIGLIVSFLISLWIGGKLAYKNIHQGNSLLLTSLKYSTIVNLIIWTTFCVIIGVTAVEDKLLMMIPPITAFVLCTLLTTFSIGLLISYIIKLINNKPADLSITAANNG